MARLRRIKSGSRCGHRTCNRRLGRLNAAEFIVQIQREQIDRELARMLRMRAEVAKCLARIDAILDKRRGGAKE